MESGASAWVLNIVQMGFRLHWISEKPSLARFPLKFPIPFNKEAVKVLDSEVSALLRKRAIVEVIKDTSPGFYSRLFTIPKANGGFRPILDLSPLNKCLAKVPFKMETANSIRLSIRPGDWAVSIDLTDAYFHVGIYPADQKWLRFHWQGKSYQFQVLPFGLSQSPWVFTRIVKVVVQWARVQGIRFHAYLDDWLVLAASQDICLQHLSKSWFK